MTEGIRVAVSKMMHEDISFHGRLRSQFSFIHSPGTVDRCLVIDAIMETFQDAFEVERWEGPLDPTTVNGIRSLSKSGKRIFLFTAFETIIQSRHQRAILASLRAAANEEGLLNCQFIFVSTAPQLAYEAPTGSSPIMDAQPFRIKPLDSPPPSLENCPGAAAAWLEAVPHCGGSRILLAESIALTLGKYSNGERRKMFSDAMESVIDATLASLRPPVKRELIETLFSEDTKDFFLDDSGPHTPHFLTELENCGLARGVRDSPGILEVLPFGNARALWTSRLRSACIGECEASPEWIEGISFVFYIERKLRSSLWAHWMSLGVDIQTRLDPVWDSITNLAQMHSNIRPASQDEMAAPLDWITAERLFDLIANELNILQSQELLGNDAAGWAELRRSFLPQRNSLAHMRWPDEVATIRLKAVWRKFVAKM